MSNSVHICISQLPLSRSDNYLSLKQPVSIRCLPPSLSHQFMGYTKLFKMSTLTFISHSSSTICSSANMASSFPFQRTYFECSIGNFNSLANNLLENSIHQRNFKHCLHHNMLSWICGLTLVWVSIFHLLRHYG